MPARVYVCDATEQAALKKLMEYDPYLDKSLTEEQIGNLKSDAEANIIFSRQDYIIKDGPALGLEREKIYLYIKASDEFLAKAEPKLKKLIQGLARVSPDMEKKIIDTIDQERTQAEQGFGTIFG